MNNKEFLNQLNEVQKLMELEKYKEAMIILDKLKDKICKPKIILLTIVRFSDEEKKKLFEMGVIDYITKPFEFEDLIESVRKLIVTAAH